ncbi:MAG: CRISPR-associated endonuclease Cas2 [Candidatus Doudnabacteria bacterium RIFCSPLOWO2_01_FULL_44_21]|uniref:CRISPR-associated endonuclease Cas2 n=1 Tax=Candidatus Doudnabacteria bacterium RIFCSPLOWO2_01_FULL_44_21 TaxID=1817841 RepID=A0A1F5Q251_9BACT|nr:MAG: CRISPR-associated endonuclease Cas2 [Candidatus Doudnabacteria bacterium RIFCSPHIGHO2_02_FULL_43_13b]OGE96197.1 MAG: CRISPR-associated endonuclease Cas2 [Candidatus Doudnabacteria bacterium RIFCSPLOWO2_01_FULL_44_21]
MKKLKKSKIKKIIAKTIKSVTNEILGMYYASPLTFSESRRQMYGLPIHPKEIPRKQLYKTAERMRQQGWLDKKKIEDKIYYEITRKGKIKYLIFKIRTSRNQRGNQATIIIFDIPEEKRTYRNFLRRLLKQMKFTMIQKSVFIAPDVLPQEFYDLLKEMKLIQYVKVIEGGIR